MFFMKMYLKLEVFQEEKKVELAMLMYNDLNLLILDEPTNHLDIDSREELKFS